MNQSLNLAQRLGQIWRAQVGPYFDYSKETRLLNALVRVIKVKVNEDLNQRFTAEQEEYNLSDSINYPVGFHPFYGPKFSFRVGDQTGQALLNRIKSTEFLEKLRRTENIMEIQAVCEKRGLNFTIREIRLSGGQNGQKVTYGIGVFAFVEGRERALSRKIDEAPHVEATEAAPSNT